MKVLHEVVWLPMKEAFHWWRMIRCVDNDNTIRARYHLTELIKIKVKRQYKP